jgi:hypothetical protein
MSVLRTTIGRLERHPAAPGHAAERGPREDEDSKGCPHVDDDEQGLYHGEPVGEVECGVRDAGAWGYGAYQIPEGDTEVGHTRAASRSGAGDVTRSRQGVARLSEWTQSPP